LGALLGESGRFVGTRSPTGRNRNVENPEIHAKLAAVLIPVTEHDVPKEFSARLSEDLVAAGNQTPSFLHARVVYLGEDVPNCCDAFLEFVEDFLAACGLGKTGEIRSLGRIVLHELNHSARHVSQVIGKLASGHGFFVRLPGEFVFGEAFQKFSGDRRLDFELREK